MTEGEYIIEETLKAENAACLMVQNLIKHKVSGEGINWAVACLMKRVTNEAAILIGRRDAETKN